MILELGLGIFCTLSAVSLYRKSAQRKKLDSSDRSPALSRIDRVAILLMSLPPEACAEVIKEINPALLTRLTVAIGGLPQIPDQMRQLVLCESLQQALSDSGAGHSHQEPGKIWLNLAMTDPALVAGICSHFCAP